MGIKSGKARIAFLLALSLSPLVAVADIKILFDVDDPARTIFPSDLFTVPDDDQNTRRRVALPSPNCAVFPIECQDIAVLNELDGFNPQPRISVPFDGPIDVESVTSETVFFLRLDRGPDERIGINQVVWDPVANTLHFESDELLAQQARYAVIVTNGVLDTFGEPVARGDFEQFRRDLNFGQTRDAQLKDYRNDLIDVTRRVRPRRVVGASVFTTLSTTSIMEKIRDQIRAATPQPTAFDIGNQGMVRAVFALDDVTAIVAQRQTGSGPTLRDPVLLPAFAVLKLIPGVGQIAFGKFTSPNYLVSPVQSIPAVPTRRGEPATLGTNDIHFNLFLPAGPKPDGGWPVAIFGHGFGSNKDEAPYILAPIMAQHGIATIAINVVGHGLGAAGRFIINTTGGPVVIPSGGRGIDQNGDGRFDNAEGSAAAPPRLLVGATDTLRQTAVDLMQLVRQVRTGIDVDGDGGADLDASRIYYFGQSFGGMYGTMFLAVEPHVRAAVPNVAGGPIIEIIRLSPVFRNGFAAPMIAARELENVAPLIVGDLVIPQFDENMPLRNENPRINNVDGAIRIQEFIDRAEWAGQVGSPVSYAPHLRKAPLSGVRAKSIIFQFAKGDQTVPNPTSTAMVRAGDFEDRVTYLRNDLAVAANSTTPLNPHTFLTNLDPSRPLAAFLALRAQTQIARFFASDGTIVIDPDGDLPFFETPIASPLPEELNFLVSP